MNNTIMFPVLSKEENYEKVVAYYETSHWLYRLLWYTPKSLAIHIGFWNDDTNTLTEALLNENKFMADTTHLTREALVLDAGCGVGGSAIWIARNIGANVVGIANEEKLVKEARKNAAMNQVENKTSFELQDYDHTNFSDDIFDVVWAIESFDYSPDKKTTFQEMRRILKTGGVLIIADFFQNREVRNRSEQKILDDITITLAVYQTQWWGEYMSILRGLGFKNIREFDKTDSVRPSSRRLYRRGKIIRPMVFLLFPLTFINKYISAFFDNWRCSQAMERAFELGLIKYGVYYAEK